MDLFYVPDLCLREAYKNTQSTKVCNNAQAKPIPGIINGN